MATDLPRTVRSDGPIVRPPGGSGTRSYVCDGALTLAELCRDFRHGREPSRAEESPSPAQACRGTLDGQGSCPAVPGNTVLPFFEGKQGFEKPARPFMTVFRHAQRVDVAASCG